MPKFKPFSTHTNFTKFCIIKGSQLKCKCGKQHKWGGYVKNIQSRAGYDKSGWYLNFTQTKSAAGLTRYQYTAICPECQKKEGALKCSSQG